jgi:hypothetical protein
MTLPAWPASCPYLLAGRRYQSKGTHDAFADGAERASIARQLLHWEDNQPCALTARSNGSRLVLEGVTAGTQQTVYTAPLCRHLGLMALRRSVLHG